MLRLFLLAWCVAVPVALAAPKKKRPPPPPKPVAAEVEIKRVLDGTQDQVSSCVIHGLEPGAKVWTQVVRLKVVVNGVGQVLTLGAVLDPENGNAAKTKACIEAVLKAATFPTTHAPMVTVEREWTFAMQ